MVRINNNIVALVFINMIVFSYVYAMEPALNDISPAVQDLIIKAQKERDSKLASCDVNDTGIFKVSAFNTENIIYNNYYKQLASIALNPENIMSKQKRLECLIGDDNFNNRKNIIKSMIENDKIDSNEIYWGMDVLPRTPLRDSVLYNKDLHFAEYLLVHGARPTKEDLKINKLFYSMYKDFQNNDALKTLFFKYKIMFYEENKNGDILPAWEDIPLQNLTESLLNLINLFKKEQTKRFFIIEVLYLKVNVIEAIEKAGFSINVLNDGLIKLTLEK